jgi:hypothetical protein
MEKRPASRINSLLVRFIGFVKVKAEVNLIYAEVDSKPADKVTVALMVP